MNTKPIPIFFAANEDYFQHLCVAMVSLLENNKEHEFMFYILTDNDHSEEIRKVLQLKNSYNNFDIQFKQIDNILLKSFSLSKTLPYISIQTYYRCLIPELFPELTKAIYLDCDLIVEGDITVLWETNIEDYYLAGVDNSCFIATRRWKKELGLDEKDIYINAGVLLMNLETMRRDHIVETMIETASKITNKIKFVDQDIINYTLKGKIKQLDSRYNWTHEHCIKFRRESQKTRYIIISHFTGFGKPWRIDHYCIHSAKKRYFDYLKKTPYCNFIDHFYSQNRSKYCMQYLIDISALYLKRYIPEQLFDLILSLKNQYTN